MDLDRLELLQGQGSTGGTGEKLREWLVQAQYKAQTPQFWTVLLVCWATFMFNFLMFTYSFMERPYVCWSAGLLLLVLAAAYLVYDTMANPKRGIMSLPIFAGCFVAVAFGSFLGLYNYDTYAIFPQFYHNTRKYTNVVSSEPSAAISDAGKIIFNHQARVDVDKSVGFISETGNLYCVAPIMDPANQPRIEYWAAGIDCCTAVGGFKCDAASNPKAGGGVRIFDNNGFFADSRFKWYEKARAKAEGEFSLQSVGDPLFVRWVEKNDLDYLQNYYRLRATIFTAFFTALFFFLFGLFSLLMWKPL